MSKEASDNEEDEILAVSAENNGAEEEEDEDEDEDDDEDEEAEEDVYVLSYGFWSNAPNGIIDTSWNLSRITCSMKTSV